MKRTSERDRNLIQKQLSDVDDIAKRNFQLENVIKELRFENLKLKDDVQQLVSQSEIQTNLLQSKISELELLSKSSATYRITLLQEFNMLSELLYYFERKFFERPLASKSLGIVSRQLFDKLRLIVENIMRILEVTGRSEVLHLPQVCTNNICKHEPKSVEMAINDIFDHLEVVISY